MTVLWGSWHWAVSGPIGPNLPVFHCPESRPSLILPSRELKGRRWDPRSLSPLPSQSCQRTEKGKRENPSVSSRSADRGPMKAERARAREHKKVCKRKRKKTGIFGPDFPSDARHLGPVWPPVWINVISRSRFFRLPFLPIYLSIYLSCSLTLFFSPPLFPLLPCFVPLVLGLPSLTPLYFVLTHRNYNSLFPFVFTRFIYLSTSSIHVLSFKFLFIAFLLCIALRPTDEPHLSSFLIASCDRFHSIFLSLFYVAYVCFFVVIPALPMTSKRKLNFARASFDLNLERKKHGYLLRLHFRC